MRWVSVLLGLLLTIGLVAGCGPEPEVPTAPAGTVPSTAPTPVEARFPAVVVRIVDGDTLVVRLAGVDTKIRLLNVDTPETKDPNKAVQCLGPEASAFLAELLPVGTPVELEYDGELLDRYGRTLAGVWLRDLLVNAEIARAGLGVPVQFNGQVKFLPPVEAAAAEAQRLQHGAYADDVDCALPGEADRALAALESVEKPGQGTAASYGAAVATLAAARRAARETAELADTVGHDGGTAAWLFHDTVRTAQRARLAAGLSRADQQLKTLKSTQKRLATKEAAAKKRAQARRARQAARERAARAERAAQAAARARAAERQRQTPRRPVKKSPPKSSGGGSNPPGYTGPRCYAPGGKTWRPC